MEGEDQKISLAVLKEQMEQNNKDHFEIKNLIRELTTEFKDFKKDCDKRYSPKWVEKFVYTLIILVVSGILGGAVSTLFK